VQATTGFPLPDRPKPELIVCVLQKIEPKTALEVLALFPLFN